MLTVVKNRIFMTMFTAVCISGFIVICTLGEVNRERRSAEKAAAAELSEPKAAYTVIERGGRIAVYCNGSDQPLKYIEADTALMPEYDLQQLREGISFANEAELRRYIDDITS